MSYDSNSNSNTSQDSYDSYKSYGKDEYYLNNYRGGGYRGGNNRGNRGSGGSGSYRGQRGGSGNGYYSNNNYRGNGGYYNKHGYGGNYYHGSGGRGGSGGRSYSGYNDQSGYYGNSNGGYENNNNNSNSNTNTENELIEGQEDDKNVRPGSSGFHRGSFRGNYRGGYRGRGGVHGSLNRLMLMTHESKIKNFNNPWINILQIDDEATQNKLETGYDQLKNVDSSISDLQKAKMKLELSMSLLEKQIDREGLHVELTNEKLEELTYL